MKRAHAIPRLKTVLDRFYNEFDFKGRLHHDPIKFPHRYSNYDDIEIAGFIASAFAYGKVTLFSPVIEKILRPAGRHPAEFFRNFSLKKDRKFLSGLHYRFNGEKDVLCFIYLISRTLKEKGSLRNLFYEHHHESDEDIRNALTGFTDHLLSIDTSPVYGKNIRPYGLKQLMPSPRTGGACKRMNLFLRWMVRDGDIDFGIWDIVPSRKLVIPLDTHIARISRCLGLTRRKSSDWKTAKEITEALKVFSPDDPLKYDFALCHHGISAHCRGERYPALCASCALKKIAD